MGDAAEGSAQEDLRVGARASERGGEGGGRDAEDVGKGGEEKRAEGDDKGVVRSR